MADEESRELRVNLVIDYHWNCNEEDGVIRSHHKEALVESAEDRIGEMMREGYFMGELHDNIHLVEEDGDDGISYSGWWGIKRTIQ